MVNRFFKLLKPSILIGLLISMNGCESWWLQNQAASSQGTLKLAVIDQPLTYKKIHEIELGYEFELIQSFAKDLGYDLRVKVYSDAKKVKAAVESGEADLGAARFADFIAKNSTALRGPFYDEDKLSWVCHKKSKINFNLLNQISKDNQFKLVTSSAYVDPDWTRAVQTSSLGVKAKIIDQTNINQIFKLLSQRKHDCTVLDRLEAKYYLRFHPKLKIVQDVSKTRAYSFLIHRHRPELEKEMRLWMTKAARRKVLSQTKSVVKMKIEELELADVKKFLHAKRITLPTYQRWLRRHGNEFGISWQLAAAVAYQESHWNPDATSFTGVRGFMQLTQQTAKHLGVEDRLDPEQSIWGGIKYLKILLDRQPKHIPVRDQVALALASYNIGPAHLKDAQDLAIKMGRNPHSWKDLKEILPLLGDETYLGFLKYGKARGQEPVDFVHRVFAYLDLMSVKI